MDFEPQSLQGIWRVRPRPHSDARGHFARIFCREEFEERGLLGHFPQISLSRNLARGTIRGLHFKDSGFAETKLVRCVAGSIFDVVVDLRAGSSTKGRWFAAELSAADGSALYIPPGFAHGFQTLTDDADVLYQISPPYRPEGEGGVRWNDPAFNVEWPLDVTRISERDQNYPDWIP